MLTLKQWVEMRLAKALKEMEEAKAVYVSLRTATLAIEEGREPSNRIGQAYADWRGLQPRKPQEGKDTPD